MKKHLQLLAFTFFLLRLTAQAQTCGVIHQTITLNTQAQVDAFPTTYPGCTRLLGELRVEGNNIVNLNGLSNIQLVDQSIWILNAPLLTNLNGLSNLKSTFSVGLWNLPLLTDLSGLESLDSAGIRIFNCPAVTSLSGLQNLRHLSSIDLSNTGIPDFKPLTSLQSLEYISLSPPNPNLKNFDGLQVLTELGGLWLSQNMVIEDFTGLDNVTKMGAIDLWGEIDSFKGLSKLDTISSWFVVFSNSNVSNFKGLDSLKFVDMMIVSGPSVTSLEGLESLKVAATYIRIEDTQITNLKGLGPVQNVNMYLWNNPALNSLEGVEDLNFALLQILDSPLLTQCAIPSVCIAIHDNVLGLLNTGAGCSTVQEVKETPVCQEVLPVTLVSFRGMRMPEGNRLAWETASETDNKGFEIQRSHNAHQFEPIGFIPGNGDSKKLRTYSYTDYSPAAPITYYRLKQLDHDGKFDYSRIIAIKEGKPALSIYPNPVKGQLNIKTSNRGQAFNLKDKTGLTVLESSVLPANGIDTSHLQTGLYYLSVGEDVFKVVVQH